MTASNSPNSADQNPTESDAQKLSIPVEIKFGPFGLKLDLRNIQVNWEEDVYTGDQIAAKVFETLASVEKEQAAQKAAESDSETNSKTVTDSKSDEVKVDEKKTVEVKSPETTKPTAVSSKSPFEDMFLDPWEDQLDQTFTDLMSNIDSAFNGNSTSNAGEVNTEPTENKAVESAFKNIFGDVEAATKGFNEMVDQAAKLSSNPFGLNTPIEKPKETASATPVFKLQVIGNSSSKEIIENLTSVTDYTSKYKLTNVYGLNGEPQCHYFINDLKVTFKEFFTELLKVKQD